MEWIVKEGDRVRVPPVPGRVDTGTVTCVLGVVAHGELTIEVRVDGCLSREFFRFSELGKITEGEES